MKEVYETINLIISRRLTDIALQIKSHNLYGIKEQESFLKVEINFAEEIAQYGSESICKWIRLNLINTKSAFMDKMKHRNEKLLATPIVDEIDKILQKLKLTIQTKQTIICPPEHDDLCEFEYHHF